MCALVSTRTFYRLGQCYEGGSPCRHFLSQAGGGGLSHVSGQTRVSVNEVSRHQSSVTTRPRLLGGYVANTTDSGDAAATNTGWTDMTGPTLGPVFASFQFQSGPAEN